MYQVSCYPKTLLFQYILLCCKMIACSAACMNSFPVTIAVFQSKRRIFNVSGLEQDDFITGFNVM